MMQRRRPWLVLLLAAAPASAVPATSGSPPRPGTAGAESCLHEARAEALVRRQAAFGRFPTTVFAQASLSGQRAQTALATARAVLAAHVAHAAEPDLRVLAVNALAALTGRDLRRDAARKLRPLDAVVADDDAMLAAG